MPENHLRMNGAPQNPYTSPNLPNARAPLPWRAVGVFMTILVVHTLLATAIAHNYLSDSALTYGDLEIAFSLWALLAVIDIATFLLLAMRTPLRDFFTLSFFSVPDQSLVQVRLRNIISVASTISLAWIVAATFLFPTATAVFFQLVLEPFIQMQENLHLDDKSPFVMSAGVLWLTLFAGAVWVLIFTPCVILLLKYCFAIHVAWPGNHSFLRHSGFTLVHEPLPNPPA